MAAFANMYQIAREPLVKDLVHYVMKDESATGFGVISLTTTTSHAGERAAYREDFVIEACELMRDRLVGDEIAHAM